MAGTGDEPVEHAAPRFARRTRRQVGPGDDIAAIHRARERHVDEPRALRGLLAQRLPRRVRGRFVVASVMQHRLARVVVILARIGQRGRRRLAQPAVVEERTEHDRVFEPLRLVHRDDLHEVSIGFEPQLRFLAAAVQPLRGQPAQRRRDTRLRGRPCLRQLGQMVDVGHATFAVRTAHQPFGDPQLARERAPHHREAAFAPQQPIPREALDPAHRVRTVGRRRAGWRIAVALLHAPQRAGIEPEPVGRERRAQTPQVAWRIDRRQHAFELFGVAGRKHRRLSQLDAADAPRREHALHEAALPVRLHEHRDVARRQRRLSQPHSPFTRAAHQPRDLGRAGLCSLRLRIALEQRTFAARQRPHPEIAGRARIGLVDERRTHTRAGAHRVIVEPVEHERARIRQEEAIARFDDRGCRALVDRERVARARPCARGEIGMQVGRAETVDRLLRIADEKQRAARREDPVEDRELQRIGILELVDQRGRIARAQRLGEPWMRVQRVIQVREQVIERYDATRALALGQLAGRHVEPFGDQREPARALRGLGCGHGRFERVGHVEERMCGCRTAFFGRLRQRGLRELQRGFRQRGRRVALLEMHGPRGERIGNRVGLVRALIQYGLRGAQQRIDRVALGRPHPRRLGEAFGRRCFG
ncbi:hypothetical protein P355_2075 [Burkholderia cenocepacia KC-01]|nr:hypothetical protein P355_2075 [Burkholderia cenocepacia KC-01]